MTNPVKDLLDSIFDSIEKYDYRKIKMVTSKSLYLVAPEDLDYANRYFFKIVVDDGLVFVNINNLERVELE